MTDQPTVKTTTSIVELHYPDSTETVHNVVRVDMTSRVWVLWVRDGAGKTKPLPYPIPELAVTL